MVMVERSVDSLGRTSVYEIGVLFGSLLTLRSVVELQSTSRDSVLVGLIDESLKIVYIHSLLFLKSNKFGDTNTH